MKAALVHDWLTGMRGGEKVLQAFCELLPGADIYTLIHVPGAVSPRIASHRINASVLNRLPGVRRYYRCLLPVMPLAARRMRVRGYDLVVAITHCVAHGVDASGSGRFVAYCLTPMRYAWESNGAYFSPRGAPDARRLLLRVLGPWLRRWDRAAAGRVDAYIADCENVRARVRRCYGREADAVIYPPVDTEFYRPMDAAREDYYLWAGALAPYKRIDLALDAFRTLGRRLVVIGEGQMERWARRHAPAGVTFLGRRPDAELRMHYARCRALVFPGEEDFGIVPLEAQACGAPVVAYARGGALETVVDLGARDRAPTGVLFHPASPGALVEAVRRFEAAGHDPAACRTNALRFSGEACRQALAAYLDL